jgi:hypothetical protein
MQKYIHIHTHTRPLSVQVQYSKFCPINSSPGYNGSFVTWTVIRMTATKFQPLTFSVTGFTLYIIANILSFMILNGSSLLPAESKSKLFYDWRSVFVSSTLVGLATRYYFLSECYCLKFAVLYLRGGGALPDERTGSAIPHGKYIRLRYKAQSVNAVWGNRRCLLWEAYGTHRCTLWAEGRGSVLNM